MTGVELILLLVGCIFMVGSFFITEKLSPSELNKLAEISESELKNIVDREINNVGVKIEEAIDGQLEASIDKVDRALERETNEKIMAINEFSDTIIENMNKTHSEIMFLYSMLNDKHTELTGMVSDLQRLAADVRNLQENMPAANAVPAVNPAVQPARVSADATYFAQPAAPEPKERKQKTGAKKPTAGKAPAADESVKAAERETGVKEEENHNEKILALYKKGYNVVDIAKKLGLGIGEVRLVIGLYKGESNS